MTRLLPAALLAAAALPALLLPSSAAAQSQSTSYAAVGYGQVDTDQATFGTVRGLVGVRPYRHFGAELEASVGVEDEGYEVSIGGSSGAYELKHDVAVYAVAFLPLGDRFEVFGRIGYGSTSVEATGGGVRAYGDGESLNYGAGASWFIDGTNGVRADWTRRDFSGDEGEADAWSISYIRRF